MAETIVLTRMARKSSITPLLMIVLYSGCIGFWRKVTCFQQSGCVKINLLIRYIPVTLPDGSVFTNFRQEDVYEQIIKLRCRSTVECPSGWAVRRLACWSNDLGIGSISWSQKNSHCVLFALIFTEWVGEMVPWCVLSIIKGSLGHPF